MCKGPGAATRWAGLTQAGSKVELLRERVADGCLWGFTGIYCLSLSFYYFLFYNLCIEEREIMRACSWLMHIKMGFSVVKQCGSQSCGTKTTILFMNSVFLTFLDIK